MSVAYRTAIKRKVLSKPAARLASNGKLIGNLLDYGCGRGDDAALLDCAGYDPHYRPARPDGPFDTVMCNYVLNVIEDDSERRAVLHDIDSLLSPGGHAYITVRNDRKALKGRTSIGTWQGLVTLILPVVWSNAGYTTYLLRKGCSDCGMTATTGE
jgi:hypothetical protein